MYRSILVPLDGSPASEHALPWALGLAQQAGAQLHLARVHLAPTPIMVGTELASDAALDTTIRNNDREYLARIAERLGAAATVNVRVALLDGGVTDALLDHARAVNADLTVMSSHGRGAFARFWLGSVADKMIRQSPVPTLLVRPVEDQAADLTVKPFIARVVVPLDGSDLAERAVDPATQLGRTSGADYTLVLVLEALADAGNLERLNVDEALTETYPGALEAKAKSYLERVAEPMRGQGLKVDTKVIRHGSAAGAVLDYAGAHGDAVIALATHGRSGIKRMILGSVADKVVRGATMPVLLYHPGETS